jgi:hypothetical protein
MMSITITIDDVDRLQPCKRDALAELLTGIVAEKPTKARPVTRPAPAPTVPPPAETPAAPAPAPAAAEPPAPAPAATRAARRGGRLGGTYRGSINEYVDTLGTHSPKSTSTVVRQLAADGLLELTRSSPRVVTCIALTRAGWKQMGRGAPPVAKPRTVTDTAAPEQSAPEIPDLGPIERRRFDPDAARIAAGDAV